MIFPSFITLSAHPGVTVVSILLNTASTFGPGFSAGADASCAGARQAVKNGATTSANRINANRTNLIKDLPSDEVWLHLYLASLRQRKTKAIWRPHRLLFQRKPA